METLDDRITMPHAPGGDDTDRAWAICRDCVSCLLRRLRVRKQKKIHISARIGGVTFLFSLLGLGVLRVFVKIGNFSHLVIFIQL